MDKVKKLNKAKLMNNVRRMIAESKFSIEWIALSLHISERVIYYWLKGERTPAIEHVYGLSQLFSVSMESILV